MDKFFNSTFDALTNVIPGAFIFCVLLFSNAKNIDDIALLTQEFSLIAGGIGLLISYVAGFIITPVGKYIFLKIGLKIFPVHYADLSTEDLAISEKFALVREYSPSNFRYIETWNMFSTLSYSLSVGFALLAVIAIYRAFFLEADAIQMAITVVISLSFFLVLLKRASVFKKWAADDMNACIKILNLVARSRV